MKDISLIIIIIAEFDIKEDNQDTRIINSYITSK